ncbi:hypothetical protein L195_g040040, partial [Trifolium pratense]
MRVVEMVVMVRQVYVPPDEGWVRVNVELHLDFLVVANTLQSRDIGSARGWSLLKKNCQHVYRETNKVVDGLANWGCENHNGLCSGQDFLAEPSPMSNSSDQCHIHWPIYATFTNLTRYPPSVLPVVSNARIRTSGSEHPSTDLPQ